MKGKQTCVRKSFTLFDVMSYQMLTNILLLLIYQCWKLFSTSLHVHVIWVCFIDSFAGIWNLQFNAGPGRISSKVLPGRDTTRWFVILLEGWTAVSDQICFALDGNTARAVWCNNPTHYKFGTITIPIVPLKTNDYVWQLSALIMIFNIP